MAFRLLAARLAVTLDQVAEEESARCCLAPAATLDQAATVSRLAQSDAWPLAAESGSEARSPGATESAGRSLQIRAANLDQDDREKAVILGQDAHQKAANLGQDVRGMAAADAQDDQVLVDRNRDLPGGMGEKVGDRANCYQDALRDRHCNTIFQRVLMP